MNFDMREYRALALRTKAPVTAASRHNLVRGFEFIQEILEEAKANASLIDRLKRYAIYGKEDEDLVEQMLPTYPVGDKAERIIQCLDLIHGLIGIIGECGEMAESLMVHIDSGEPLNVNNIQEESSDITWFLNLILAFSGKLDIVDISEANLNKLKIRFPKLFTIENYDKRDREKEMLAFNSETGQVD